MNVDISLHTAGTWEMTQFEAAIGAGDLREFFSGRMIHIHIFCLNLIAELGFGWNVQKHLRTRGIDGQLFWIVHIQEAYPGVLRLNIRASFEELEIDIGPVCDHHHTPGEIGQRGVPVFHVQICVA